jgi:hypothetical protein
MRYDYIESIPRELQLARPVSAPFYLSKGIRLDNRMLQCNTQMLAAIDKEARIASQATMEVKWTLGQDEIWKDCTAGCYS